LASFFRYFIGIRHVSLSAIAAHSGKLAAIQINSTAHKILKGQSPFSRPASRVFDASGLEFADILAGC
jgi:hypothetical protein